VTIELISASFLLYYKIFSHQSVIPAVVEG
jgi:hypothetical protein